MGFLATLAGVPDANLLASGHAGRGLILDITHTGTMLESNDGVDETICIFILEIRRPGEQVFYATTRQRFPWHQLDEIEPGQTLVAVRIDPHNRDRVAIDWRAPVVLTSAAGD
jgi:hypothetical protein